MKTTLPWILCLVIGFFWLKQCSITKTLKSEKQQIQIKTDTIIKKVPFKLSEPLDFNINPVSLIFWKTDTLKVPFKEWKIKKDTLVLYSNENQIHDSLNISKEYIIQYPQNDKLLELKLSHSKLDITLLNIQGKVLTKNFDINPDQWSYVYNNGNLSAKRIRKLKLQPSISYSFRPFKNFHDLDFDLKFNTTRFNYVLGLNCFYYPSLKSNPGLDLKLGFQYNF